MQTHRKHPDDDAAQGYTKAPTEPAVANPVPSGVVAEFLPRLNRASLTRPNLSPEEWDRLLGSWPGDESDAEVARALEALS